MVSVIIPVYNVEKYLRDCIESVLRQTYADIETILVNDGSTDASPEICDDYARRFDSVRVIHQKNEGPSGARNAGLKAAVGDYVYFLDSDDYIRDDAIETMAREAKRNGADIILFDGVTVDKSGQPLTDARFSGMYARKNSYPASAGIELLRQMIRNREYSCSVPLTFIKNSFLRANSLSFYPGILHEDKLFTFQALVRAPRAAHIPEALFFRRRRPGSIMESAFTHKNIIGYCRAVEGIIDVCDLLPVSMRYVEFATHIIHSVSIVMSQYFNLERDGAYNAKQDTCGIFKKMKSSRFLNIFGMFNGDFYREYPRARRVIFYGAGAKCINVLKTLSGAGARMPDVIWDINSGNIPSVNGIRVCAPDFEGLRDADEDIVVVCIADINAYIEVSRLCLEHGGTKIFHWWEFFLPDDSGELPVCL